MLHLPRLIRTAVRPVVSGASKQCASAAVIVALPRVVTLPRVSAFATAATKSTTSTTGKKRGPKPKAAGSKTTKRAASTKTKTTKPKKDKLKPWQARDADGKLIPLPSASKPTLRSTFLIYMADRIDAMKSDPEYQKTSPKTGKQVIDIVKFAKAVGQEWRALPASDKAKYEAQHEKEKKEYETALAKWRASLTPEDIKRQNKFISAQRKKGKSGVALYRDPAKPKRPNTAFFEFLNEQRAKETTIPNVTEFARKGGERWKQMTADERAPYEQRAAGAQEQYKKDLEEYMRAKEAQQ